MSMSQANSSQNYFLSRSITPTSRPAAERLNGTKFVIKNHTPEVLPLGSNDGIYLSSSVCVRYRQR